MIQNESIIIGNIFEGFYWCNLKVNNLKPTCFFTWTLFYHRIL